MKKFKVGDTIIPKDGYPGFEKATIIAIDNKHYHLKIVNGKATIPLKAIECYQVSND